MNTKEVDIYMETLHRDILVTIIKNVMKEYPQVRRQVRGAVREIYNESTKNKGIKFPLKSRR